MRVILAAALAATAAAHLVAFRPSEAGVLAINLALLATAALVWNRLRIRLLRQNDEATRFGPLIRP